MRQAANPTETTHQSDFISATQAAISQTLHVPVIALQQGANNLYAFLTKGMQCRNSSDKLNPQFNAGR
ncbi:MAG: hypothetical protein WAW87_02755 [Candidatus Ferrigenium altingense]